jgi:phosphoglycerate-specific signal transduction histidine kinase
MRKRVSGDDVRATDGDETAALKRELANVREQLLDVEKRKNGEMRDVLDEYEKRKAEEFERLGKRVMEIEKMREDDVNALKKRIAELEKANVTGKPVEQRSPVVLALSTEEKLRRAVVAEFSKFAKKKKKKDRLKNGCFVYILLLQSKQRRIIWRI